MHSTGAYPYRYKKPLAPGARIKLTKTRADYRVVSAMANLHHYPASCCATRPQVRWGVAPLARGPAAPLKSRFKERGFEGEREIEIPLSLRTLSP